MKRLRRKRFQTTASERDHVPLQVADRHLTLNGVYFATIQCFLEGRTSAEDACHILDGYLNLIRKRKADMKKRETDALETDALDIFQVIEHVIVRPIPYYTPGKVRGEDTSYAERNGSGVAQSCAGGIAGSATKGIGRYSILRSAQGKTDQFSACEVVRKYQVAGKQRSLDGTEFNVAQKTAISELPPQPQPIVPVIKARHPNGTSDPIPVHTHGRVHSESSYPPSNVEDRDNSGILLSTEEAVIRIGNTGDVHDISNGCLIPSSNGAESCSEIDYDGVGTKADTGTFSKNKSEGRHERPKRSSENRQGTNGEVDKIVMVCNVQERHLPNLASIDEICSPSKKRRSMERGHPRTFHSTDDDDNANMGRDSVFPSPIFRNMMPTMKFCLPCSEVRGSSDQGCPHSASNSACVVEPLAEENSEVVPPLFSRKKTRKCSGRSESSNQEEGVVVPASSNFEECVVVEPHRDTLKRVDHACRPDQPCPVRRAVTHANTGANCSERFKRSADSVHGDDTGGGRSARNDVESSILRRTEHEHTLATSCAEVDVNAGTGKVDTQIGTANPVEGQSPTGSLHATVQEDERCTPGSVEWATQLVDTIFGVGSYADMRTGDKDDIRKDTKTICVQKNAMGPPLSSPPLTRMTSRVQWVPDCTLPSEYFSICFKQISPTSDLRLCSSDDIIDLLMKERNVKGNWVSQHPILRTYDLCSPEKSAWYALPVRLESHEKKSWHLLCLKGIRHACVHLGTMLKLRGFVGTDHIESFGVTFVVGAQQHEINNRYRRAVNDFVWGVLRHWYKSLTGKYPSNGKNSGVLRRVSDMYASSIVHIENPDSFDMERTAAITAISTLKLFRDGYITEIERDVTEKLSVAFPVLPGKDTIQVRIPKVLKYPQIFTHRHGPTSSQGIDATDKLMK